MSEIRGNPFSLAIVDEDPRRSREPFRSFDLDTTDCCRRTAGGRLSSLFCHHREGKVRSALSVLSRQIH